MVRNMNKKLESRVTRLEKIANEKFGYTAKESMKALDHCYDVISQVEQSFKRGVGMDSGLDEEHTISTINAIDGLLNIIKKYYLSSY